MKITIDDKQMAALKRDWFNRGFNAAAEGIYNSEPDQAYRLNTNHPKFVADRNKAFAAEELKK